MEEYPRFSSISQITNDDLLTFQVGKGWIIPCTSVEGNWAVFDPKISKITWKLFIGDDIVLRKGRNVLMIIPGLASYEINSPIRSGSRWVMKSKHSEVVLEFSETCREGNEEKFIPSIDHMKACILRASPVINTKEQDDKNCVICLDNPKDICILPCKHLCMCTECSEKIKDLCPMCRGPIVEQLKIFA